ncbi:TRAP transporter substrate-binding protein DctP [Streptomyces sp. NPDC047043]|uniref:TRAP transporter substrate-binding protein n=1 Tax=Streptomyces sp. NPDC047043 TaxID=3154497 RepID=UPI0033EBFDCA
MRRVLGVSALLLALAACTSGTSKVQQSPSASAGESPTVIRLTMAVPYGTTSSVDRFIAQVGKATEGSLQIKAKQGWRTGQLAYEDGTIADVRAGEADLGVAGTRAFPGPVRILSAPELITSYAAQERLLNSPLYQRLGTALSVPGITGLGLLPGQFRYLFTASGSAPTPAALHGRLVGVAQSKLADSTFHALGARTRWYPLSGSVSDMDGVESSISSFNHEGYISSTKYLTGNLALWPRIIVPFISDTALKRLSPQQRQALTGAAAATFEDTMSELQSEDADELADLCAGGLVVRQASPAQLVAYRAAVASVGTRLENDPQTGELFTMVKSLVKGAKPEPALHC